MTSFNVNQIKALFSTVSTVDFEVVNVCRVDFIGKKLVTKNYIR